jgi:hypothetical protein
METVMNPAITLALRSLRLPVALAALVTVLAAAFAWPASDLGPRDVPIAVTGSTRFVGSTTDALNARDPGAFDITVAPNAAAGRAMLHDNDVYGLYQESLDGTPELRLASAGRPAVADLLASVEAQLSRSPNPRGVTDEVAPPRDDPHSAAFTSSALPIVLGAIAAGSILALGRRSRASRFLSGAVVAGLSGLAVTAVMSTWLGALDGNWWRLAGCYALGVGAIVAAVNGVANILGRAGLMAVAGTIMLLGNPLSAATSAPELLPDGWSALGQVLPPGALDTAIRSVAYYDSNGASSAVLVLAAWVAVGSLLMVAGPAASFGRPRRRIAITHLTEQDVENHDERAHLAHLG